MRVRVRFTLTAGAAAAALLLALATAAPRRADAAAPGTPAASVPNDAASVAHALNRLAWGPRPGDVERMQRLGLGRWIDAQLRPERLSAGDVDARLAQLETIGLSSRVLLQRYDLPREAKREIQERRAEMEDASEEQQRAARREFLRKYAAQMDGSPRQVLDELQAAKIVRAAHSERQLDELLVDFWMNHFNVYAQKGPLRFVLGEYEREVIRPHAWGRFEDLLVATAKSPAMLFYLDNWLSADPKAAERLEAERARRTRGGFGRFGRRGRATNAGADAAQPQRQARRSGLNENYARELMELHTLGVDGGYTQRDVTEVARAFTGWTLGRIRQGEASFRFEPRLHDQGDKTVLGQRIEGGGQDEGERILHLLATHPSTAHFITLKLARRFVADEPSEALVARGTETFRRTQGDMRAVLTTLVTSPEFFAPAQRAAKVKTPLDFVVSAVRAAGVAVEDGRDLARRVADMGMPLYLQQPPTGYKDTADAWVSTSGLLARLNFALDLTAGRVRGLSGGAALLADLNSARPDDAQRRLVAQLVPQGLSETTAGTLEREREGGLEPARLAGLILGSPEFQRR